MKEWLQKRNSFSHTNLLNELKVNPKDWHNYRRMDEETYFKVLSIVSPLIKRQDTILRQAITPHERLTATLRFLATGRTYEDLKFSAIISPQALGKIIPETCDAIFKGLKDYYKGPEFDWNNEMQGYILSSFFYGYITTQLLGGYLAAKFGGKLIFGAGIGVTALLTLITPWLASANVYLLLAVRIIEGIFEGVTYPCIHAIWAKWAPPLERSRLATIAFSGSYAGTVVAMPACAYLANVLGWPSIFYMFGAVGLVWYVLWITIVEDSPELDKKISKSELDYILNSLKATSNFNKQVQIPWKQILTSSAVWAIVISHFSENWGFYTLLTQLPKYLKDIHDYNLEKSGFLSGLPYLVMSIMMQFSGQWADWFRERGILTTTQVRKILNCSGFIAQTIFMMGAAFWSDRIGTVFCLTLAVGLGAFAWAGFSVNHLDIAPQYASVLMGIGNTIATLPGIVSPILSGYLVSKPPQIHEWQIVFYISAGIYLFGAVIYGTFASGELQPWAIEKVENTTEKKENKHGIENKTFTSDEEL